MAHERYQIETEDKQRADAWDELPWSHEVVIWCEIDRNHATSWIRPVVGDDEIELAYTYDDNDVAILKGLYPSPQAAEKAIAVFVAARRCNHEIGLHSGQDLLPSVWPG